MLRQVVQCNRKSGRLAVPAANLVGGLAKTGKAI